MGFKLAEGRGLREGRHSKQLWKSVEKVGPPSLLEEIDQFVHGHFNVAQYGTQQAGT